MGAEFSAERGSGDGVTLAKESGRSLPLAERFKANVEKKQGAALSAFAKELPSKVQAGRLFGDDCVTLELSTLVMVGITPYWVSEKALKATAGYQALLEAAALIQGVSVRGIFDSLSEFKITVFVKI